MPITFKVDVTDAVAGVADIAKRQIPFILAKSLTDTAKQGQKASQESLTSRSRFTLRNAWTSSSIRITPALKTGSNGTIKADVHTDFSRRPGATDYLALQEEESYVKVSSKTYLCIPTDALRALAGGAGRIIPDSLKPTALLNYCNQVFEYDVTKGKNKGTLRGVRSPHNAVRGWVFFTDTRVGVGAQRRQHIHLKSGARAIWGRRVGQRKPTVFYVMVHQTGSVRGRFHMEQVIQEVVDANFRNNWDKNWKDLFAKGFRA